MFFSKLIFWTARKRMTKNNKDNGKGKGKGRWRKNSKAKQLQEGENEVLQKIRKKLKEHIQLLMQETNMVTVSLGNEDCLHKIKYLMCRLQKMQCVN